MDIALKICGLKYHENINDVILKIMPDYIGLIFYSKSPRYFKNTLSAQYINTINKAIKKVGVFVNETTENIVEAIKIYNLQAVQLHGNETPKQCEALSKYATIIKAFGVNHNFNFETLSNFAGVVNYFLFDTKTTLHGGSGIVFNWEILKNYALPIPYILSGGINNHNIASIKLLKNKPAIIDVNSKYELEPGLKNIAQLLTLKNILQHD